MNDLKPAGRVPRRAMFSVWSVFLSMAGTTMTFQVYHSIHFGGMPWELAVLYGVVPLAISIGVLDFVAEWEDAPKWAAPSAYLITAGSMFLSAAATGSVVLHAAPAHLSGVFGLLLDGAALLAIRFILTAPRKARERAVAQALQQAAAERAEAGQVATLERALDAERAAHQDAQRAAREQADAARDARAADAARAQEELNAARAAAQAIDAARAEAERQAAAVRAEAQRLAVLLRAGDEAVAGMRAELEAAATAVRESAEARAAAEKRAASADARGARAARKEEGGARADAARKDAGARAQGRAPKDEADAEADVDARTKALGILERNPGISAAQLGLDAGMSKRWGQDHKAEFMAMLAELAEDAPEPAAGPEDAP